MSTTVRTTNMLVAALGGEGGGVLTNWLIEVAQQVYGPILEGGA